MGFTGAKDGSQGFVKRVASSFSNMRRKKSTVESKGLPRSKSTGGNFESMRLPAKKDTVESAGVSPQPRRGKIDGHEKHKLGKLRCFDDSDSIWLSSEHRLSVSFHFSVDESVVSWLSNLANSSPSLNLRANSIKERRRKKLDGSVSWNIKEGKTIASDQNPVGTSSCPGGNKNLSEESDSSENTRDPNIPTGSSLAEDKCSEIADSEKRNVVEPLFWPFEQIFDWTPEDIMKHFSMSPRRKKWVGAKASAGTSPRSMRQQLHTRRLEFKEGCKRKLVFNGPLPKNSKIPELKRTVSNNSKKSDTDRKKDSIKRIKSLPSRFRNSTNLSTKVVPIESAEEKSTTRKSITFLEDDFAFINDLSIEKVVGLDEFNGREGIDSDFNGEVFLLDDSDL